MSNNLALSSVQPSKLPARIKWPVLEIGKNSVRPSTIPRIAALSNRGMSCIRRTLTFLSEPAREECRIARRANAGYTGEVFQRDYLLRVIQQAAEAIARALRA